MVSPREMVLRWVLLTGTNSVLSRKEAELKLRLREETSWFAKTHNACFHPENGGDCVFQRGKGVGSLLNRANKVSTAYLLRENVELLG